MIEVGLDVISDAQESSSLKQDSAKRVWKQFDQSAQNLENAFWSIAEPEE